jgi:hypothetical protein
MIPAIFYSISAVILSHGVNAYLTIALLILANFGEGFTNAGIW